MGAKSIGILVQNDEYGVKMKDELIKAFSGEVVLVELFEKASSDFRGNTLKLIEKQDEIDVLFVINNMIPEPFFSQLNELNWSKPIVSDVWTITSPNMKNRTLASGVDFVDYKYTPQINLLTDEQAIEYANKFQEQFNLPPILLGALTYDSYLILDKAIDAVGGDPNDLAKYIVNRPEYDGVSGKITFDSSCQVKNPEVVWRKVLSNGDIGDIE